MQIRKSDIRLIDGDVALVSMAIKEYLPNANFKLDQEKLGQNCAVIKSSNTQRSFLKLYFSNNPQIVHWHLIQMPGNKVQIEVKSDLFPQFRFFYYAIIGLLLTGSFLFFTATSSFKYNSFNFLQQFGLSSFSSFDVLITASFLIFAFIFFLRSINSIPYEIFLNQFYEISAQNNPSNEIVLQSALGFPDFIKVSLLFVLFFLITLSFTKINIYGVNKHLSHYYYIGGAIIIISILLILSFIMASQSSSATRAIFILVGLSLCVPTSIYSNAPVALSFTGDIQQRFESHFENKTIIGSDILASKYLSDYDKMILKFILKISMFYVSVSALLFLFASVFFINIINLPIRIIRDSKRFLSTQPDSAYYQALHPENSSYLFNLVIVLLWAAISIVNILGLYFSFSILERILFNKNILFESELAKMFFDNTQLTFTILMRSIFGGGITILFHRMVMLFYSIPIITIFFLVLKKNLKAIIKKHSLLKNQDGKNEKFQKHLIEKINKICEFADIRVPTIRFVDSPNIHASSQYLGFPTFKNVLVLSKGTLDELHDNDDELNVLLAHEIWHIKKHTLIRRFLCFLSDYSLFGNGFLALLQNSYKIEKEADDFAVKWLIKKHQEKSKAINSLRSLLEKAEEVNWKNALLQSTNFFFFAMFKEDSLRNKFI